MAGLTFSLQSRFRLKVFRLAIIVFLAITVMTLYFIDVLNQSAAKHNLVLKHRAAEQAFNGYLARAEDEMTFIGQDLSLNNYAEGRELDLLFSHHEVLFFGGLDFFYIDWLNGQQSIDPRARLFTEIDLKSVLKKGLINRWSFVVMQDNAIFLLFKKPLVSEDQLQIGFLYGFISLNDNLTLANELLESAQVTGVRIYDPSQDLVLLEEYKTGVDLSGETLYSTLPLASPVQADLQLEIIQKHSFSSDVLTSALPLIGSIALVLFGACLFLFRQVKALIFQPLENIVYQNEDSLLPYQELQPIQLQSQQYKAFLSAKDRRFQLLTESVNSAIIFCNEVAGVELINAEAQDLFPDVSKARTLFDFMPISVHQSIQDALKGDVGVFFDITDNALGRIYHWQAFSFKNESDFRGLLLVGRDVTQVTSLTWQLEQLQPLTSALQNKVDVDAIMSEVAYLAALPCSIEAKHLQGWLLLLVDTLEDIASAEESSTLLLLGDVFCQESEQVMRSMGVEANRVLLDCSVGVGSQVVMVDRKFRGLIRVLFMMVMSNEMAERRLTVRFDGNVLEMIAMHDMASRPLFAWMIGRLMALLGGKQQTLQNNALQIHLTKETYKNHLTPNVLPEGIVVAWVANDYPRPLDITKALTRLGVQVEEYVSADSFFTQYSVVSHFDVIIIGCDADCRAQTDMTHALMLKYNREDLPIVWLNSVLPAAVELNVLTMQGCSFDYNLQKVVSQACQRECVIPRYSNESSLSWVIVGGSRVTKAIWYAELEDQSIETQWLTDLSHYNAVLSYNGNAPVVLLEPQPKEILLAIQLAFPKIRFFSVQSWPEIPDNVTLFEMNVPFSGNQIRLFIQQVMQQTSTAEKKE